MRTYRDASCDQISGDRVSGVTRWAVLGTATLGIALMSGGCPVRVGVEVEVGGNGTVDAFLDETNATITISAPNGNGTAGVLADLFTSNGSSVELENGQSIFVAGVELGGPNSDGDLEATVTAGNTYTLTVNEPSRGSTESVITGPTAFNITAPAENATASLSGFTLTWDAVDPSQTVAVTLSQPALSRMENTVGPFADSGSLTLSASDLGNFGQGGPLIISITKVRVQTGLSGFNTSTATLSRTGTLIVNPGP